MSENADIILKGEKDIPYEKLGNECEITSRRKRFVED